MNSKALEILKKLTKPISKEEMTRFIAERHGDLSRDNTLSDINDLDEVGQRALAEAAEKRGKTGTE